MPEGYDDEGYEDDYGTDGPYDDGYYDDEGYDGSRYDDDYGYDEAYGYDEDSYPVEGEEGYGPAPYYDAPEYVPDYPENGVGDLLYYVDEHEWINCSCCPRWASGCCGGATATARTPTSC